MPIRSPAPFRGRVLHCREGARRLLTGIVLAAFTTGPVAAQQLPADRDPSPHSDASLVTEVATVAPGASMTVAVRLTFDAGWHTYWINPGDAGLPLTVKWSLPAGVSAGPLEFPTPHLTPQPPLMSYGYENEVLVLSELRVPASAVVGSTLHLEGKAEWLTCADVCLPASARVSLDVPVQTGVGATTASSNRIASSRAQVPTPTPGWKTYGWTTPIGYVVTLIAKGDAPAFPSPYFFIDSADVLEHASAQRIGRRGDTLVLSLPHAASTGVRPTRLRGVISGNTSDARPRGQLVTVALTGTVPVALRARALAILDDTSTRSYGGITVGDTVANAPVAATSASTFDPNADMTLFAAVAFAFLGGLILNLMPCVFPVLSVKILALLEHGSSRNPSHGRKHGLAFGAGVLLSFWALAGVLLALRAGGETLGWGFQLQSPPVVALLALLVFALGLNLSGVFEIGLSLTRLGAAGGGGSVRDSLLTGGLAVLVAAPCTAPFMGAALGYALVQPAMIGLLVFTALAIGLALPFVVLASMPQLLRFLPRPGPWLETLKQFLAFPLYITVVWLLWVFGLQTGMDSLAILLIAMIVVALGAWLWARGVRADRLTTKVVAAALLVAAAGVGVVAGRRLATPLQGGALTVTTASAASGTWEPWSAARVSALRAEGRTIFIDFTAAWCLSCQVNERVALRTGAVNAAFARGNVALLRADWTSRDDAITQVLASFGRSGVPLYVLYPADARAAATILPAVLTPGIVVSAVTRATSTALVSAIR